MLTSTHYEAPCSEFFQHPATSSILGPNILNNLSLCSSVAVKDQVSNTFKTIDEVIQL
jgi:hypothetical protein